MKHPMQPIVLDQQGVARFKENKIVRYLLEHGGIDMNQLARLDFPREDQSQFAQLIGYSVSGFGDLSYAQQDEVAAADMLVENPELSPQEARIQHLTQELQAVRDGLRGVVAQLYGIHPDDLGAPE